MPRDHFTRYERPTSDHLHLAYGEVLELRQIRRTHPTILAAQFVGFVAFAAFICFGALCAVAAITG